jgi:iron complex transport system substrate-binding protein
MGRQWPRAIIFPSARFRKQMLYLRLQQSSANVIPPTMSHSVPKSRTSPFPRRIVCLSDEVVELIYLLGEQDRIVGVSGFSVRPPEVRLKPRVSTFRDANFDSIAQLEPDLIITYSDVQAEITREASLRGFTVLNCNQRSIAEIFETIAMVSRILGKQDDGDALIASYASRLERMAAAAHKVSHRPRVFFEEWNDPIISGIEWVEELIEIAGGELIFPELRKRRKAKDRMVQWESVIERNPDVIFASWCGMKVNVEQITSRPRANEIAAIRLGQIFEIPSSLILQPGPAALTDGVDQLHALLAKVANRAATMPQG